MEVYLSCNIQFIVNFTNAYLLSMSFISSKVPFDPAKFPIFYGWIILGAGSFGILMSTPGQTIGVSVFTDSLIDILHLSRDELSLCYLFGTVGSSFLLPWAGRMYDQWGARSLALIASLGLGAILGVLSLLDVLVFQWMKIESTMGIFIITSICFLFLRFFGQGVLTMTSRNMMMEWFEQRRGFATGFSNVFVSLMFSGAPIVLFYFIENYQWNGAWLIMAVVAGLIAPVVIFILFRDKPEDSGLKPDGEYIGKRITGKHIFPIVKQFNKEEVLRHYPFWVIALLLAMQGLYITGFTFHIISIFEQSGFSEAAAIRIFLPSAVIAVIVTLVASSVSDRIQIKYLLIAKGLGASMAVLGMITLSFWHLGFYLIVVGTGFMSGLFSVLTSVTWPRYYGRKYLGAISGQATMMIVFGSALGPILFSSSLTYFGDYQMAGWVCLFIFLILTACSLKANNPQKALSEE